jgi:L-aminopeptidase/D-esterase-like protein
MRIRLNLAVVFLTAVLSALVSMSSLAAQTPRARGLGVPFSGTPAKWNAITDVPGVEVGYSTLISGQGKLIVGQGPVRTGVTAIWPRGKQSVDSTFAGWYSQNGNGEMTGTTWIEESGFLDGPVLITNTHTVGIARDAYIEWQVRNKHPSSTDNLGDQFFSLPVVAETYDGFLNDINGFHVKPDHVFHALDTAASGPIAEGNVGGGTGMVCYGFKGGSGTSSRVLPDGLLKGYTVGVFVQCNCGRRPQLQIAGVPVGLKIPEDAPYAKGASWIQQDVGSIIIVIATDAPLLPHQLKRLARRATMGLARTGSTSGNGSGDIFVAFSTANAGAVKPAGLRDLKMVPNDDMNPMFEATVQATEEAIVNAMVGAETMTGVDDHRVIALPHQRLRDVLKEYNKLQ